MLRVATSRAHRIPDRCFFIIWGTRSIMRFVYSVRGPDLSDVHGLRVSSSFRCLLACLRLRDDRYATHLCEENNLYR